MSATSVDVPCLVARINELFPSQSAKSPSQIGFVPKHIGSPRAALFQLAIDVEQR
jgi:hypothetical protein